MHIRVELELIYSLIPDMRNFLNLIFSGFDVVRSLYFTIGFSPEFVVPKLQQEGLKDVVSVKLVRVVTGRSEDKKCDLAIDTIRGLLRYSNVELRVISLSAGNRLEDNIVEIAREILRDVSIQREVVVNVSGGPRILVICALLAAITVKALVPTSRVNVELTPEYSVELLHTVDLTSVVDTVARGLEYVLSEIRGKRLQEALTCIVRRGKAKVEDLKQQLQDLSESTIRNYVHELVQLDLVRTCGHGVYEATPIGKVLSILLDELQRIRSSRDLG